ncbi:5264_t:CDS:2 [Diversispora eburnea]|uniref:Sulfide:quinone oxidoreductase, mitochondrial n=1 Tax=Diversispora eburnea TaxID=1213867 RepID=A0A9N9FMA1_9GLOM|nr:5264_t:CDS:2 [Diversispora eburnea]
MFGIRRYFQSVNVQRSLARTFATAKTELPSYKVVVIGGGTGGLAVSSTLSEILGKHSVAIIEPSNVHYVYWVKNKVEKVDPETNSVVLQDGSKIKYDYLVVAPGIQINWDHIKGLPEAIGKNGVSSNYSADTVEKTWDFIKEFRGGNAIFTMPSTPIKCPGAAIKIAYLAEDYFTKNRIRSRSNVIYNSAMGKIFAIDKYAASLNRIAKERNIEVNLFTNLVEVRGDKKEAVFKDGKTNEEKVFNYEFLHVVPPMGPPPFIAASKIGNAAGWVDVDQYTMQHLKYPNIFSLGDASSAPTSKTAAAISPQSGVLKKNLLDLMEGKFDKGQAARYDGYASCPLLVGRNKLVLAEFSGYTTKPMETFPFDQGKERSTMYYLTKEVIPDIYWNRLLKGSWVGPAKVRHWLSYIP